MGGVASDSLSHPQTSQTARNWLPRETVSPLVCGHGALGVRETCVVAQKV